jgi:hypothetical protein
MKLYWVAYVVGLALLAGLACLLLSLDHTTYIITSS